MKIEANDKEVQDIFALGYFKIPLFLLRPDVKEFVGWVEERNPILPITIPNADVGFHFV